MSLTRKSLPDLDLQLNIKAPSTPHYGPGNSANKVYSPVTDLAINLNELSTCYDNTPKRRLSLASNDGDTPLPIRPIVLQHQLSSPVSDHGCCLDSPGPVSPLDFSLSYQDRFDSLIPDSKLGKDGRSPLELASSAFRRFQSMRKPSCLLEPTPPPTQHFSRCPEEEIAELSSPGRHKRTTTPKKCAIPSPVFSIGSPSEEDESSQDSGVGLEKENSKEFEFRQPVAPAPRRLRVLSDETNSPRHSPYGASRPVSAPANTLHFSGSLLRSGSGESPLKLRRSSLTSSPQLDEGDDGFLELLDTEDDSEKSQSVPSGLDKLINAPLVESPAGASFIKSNLGKAKRPLFSQRLEAIQDQENSPMLAGSRRGLFRSPSAPRLFQERSNTFCSSRASASSGFKRSEPCREGDSTPVQTKRRKSVVEDSTPEKRATPVLHRCHSESETLIKSAMSRADAQPDLIADFSKPYSLPLCKGKHADMKAISPDTVSDLLNGEYSHVVEKFMIIDCRYPYEYKGGHIAGAKNIYTCEDIHKEFMRTDEHRQPCQAAHKRNILVFHCEFSSERGPKMSRFLRKNDRESNKECYPSLHYPEVYLLEGGYKAFYQQHKEQCVPQEYLPMLHEDHGSDLKHFRAKSKSWAGERGGRHLPRSAFKL